MNISIASLSDSYELDILVNAGYRGDSARKGWTHEADYLGGIRTNEEEIQKMMLNPNAVILKVTETNKIIACVYLEKKAKTLYLGMLTVLPTLQAKGTGKLLMQAAEDYAKQNDCQSIEMTVISKRTELIAYYERRGYQLTGEKRPFPMNNPSFGEPKEFLEFVVMQKNIF